MAHTQQEPGFSDLFSGAPTIDGLDSWVVYSNDGSGIPLVLEENRRMKIEAILDCAETWGAGAWNLLFSAGTEQDTRSLSREIIEKFMQPAQRRLGSSPRHFKSFK